MCIEASSGRTFRITLHITDHRSPDYRSLITARSVQAILPPQDKILAFTPAASASLIWLLRT